MSADIDLNALREQLIEHEGLRLKPYICPAGKYTIGVGRNIQDTGISRDEAMYLLDNDINRVLAELDDALPWWREMTEARQRVLADMNLNLGITKLLKFKHTLAAMQRGDYEAAAGGMMNSLWYRQVGKRGERLVAMMRIGE